jgi:hypothetical protein
VPPCLPFDGTILGPCLVGCFKVESGLDPFTEFYTVTLKLSATFYQEGTTGGYGRVSQV